jgi:hypothetical protein
MGEGGTTLDPGILPMWGSAGMTASYALIEASWKMISGKEGNA